MIYVFYIRRCIYEIYILIEISKNKLGEQKKVSSKTKFNQRDHVSLVMQVNKA